MTFNEWANRHPRAAMELVDVFSQSTAQAGEAGEGKSESWAQSQFRILAATAGDVYWRNNVGANKVSVPVTCPVCANKFSFKQPALRWGLCNDSTKLNEKFKSSDLIGIKQHLVTREDVGKMLGLFSAVEMKEPGWVFNPTDPHQAAQAAFGSIVLAKGGHFAFSTGGY